MSARLYTLDYLRGLAAFGIMVYHFLFWLHGPFMANQFLGRVGIYGVAIFYVLSGLTLYHVYEYSNEGGRFSLSTFFKKRFFRIFPLLWLVTICAIILSQKQPNLIDLLLNLSGMFGFLRWDVSFATGAWSIGNELVFYSVFPLILFACMRSRLLLFILLIAAATLHHYFSFHVLDANHSSAEQWHDYVNPLNQIFFFISGCVIGFLTKQRHFAIGTSTSILIGGLALFILTPAVGNNIVLLTGVNRWIFTAACLLICLGAYKLNIPLTGKLHSALKMLGESSYSVYLLHGLVFTVWAFLLKKIILFGFDMPLILKVLVPITLTLFLSYFVYTYFEKFFMQMGKSPRFQNGRS
jgi:exopolysaccharide production protein ExoZ